MFNLKNCLSKKGQISLFQICILVFGIVAFTYLIGGVFGSPDVGGVISSPQQEFNSDDIAKKFSDPDKSASLTRDEITYLMKNPSQLPDIKSNDFRWDKLDTSKVVSEENIGYIPKDAFSGGSKGLRAEQINNIPQSVRSKITSDQTGKLIMHPDFDKVNSDVIDGIKAENFVANKDSLNFPWSNSKRKKIITENQELNGGYEFDFEGEEKCPKIEGFEDGWLELDNNGHKISINRRDSTGGVSSIKFNQDGSAILYGKDVAMKNKELGRVSSSSLGVGTKINSDTILAEKYDLTGVDKNVKIFTDIKQVKTFQFTGGSSFGIPDLNIKSYTGSDNSYDFNSEGSGAYMEIGSGGNDGISVKSVRGDVYLSNSEGVNGDKFSGQVIFHQAGPITLVAGDTQSSYTSVAGVNLRALKDSIDIYNKVDGSIPLVSKEKVSIFFNKDGKIVAASGDFSKVGSNINVPSEITLSENYKMGEIVDLSGAKNIKIKGSSEGASLTVDKDGNFLIKNSNKLGEDGGFLGESVIKIGERGENILYYDKDKGYARFVSKDQFIEEGVALFNDVLPANSLLKEGVSGTNIKDILSEVKINDPVVNDVVNIKNIEVDDFSYDSVTGRMMNTKTGETSSEMVGIPSGAEIKILTSKDIGGVSKTGIYFKDLKTGDWYDANSLKPAAESEANILNGNIQDTSSSDIEKAAKKTQVPIVGKVLRVSTGRTNPKITPTGTDLTLDKAIDKSKEIAKDFIKVPETKDQIPSLSSRIIGPGLGILAALTIVGGLTVAGIAIGGGFKDDDEKKK